VPYKPDSDQLSMMFIRKTATRLPSESEKTMWSPSIMAVWASTMCMVIVGGLSLTRNLLSAIVNFDAMRFQLLRQTFHWRNMSALSISHLRHTE